MVFQPPLHDFFLGSVRIPISAGLFYILKLYCFKTENLSIFAEVIYEEYPPIEYKIISFLNGVSEVIFSLRCLWHLLCEFSLKFKIVERPRNVCAMCSEAMKSIH